MESADGDSDAPAATIINQDPVSQKMLEFDRLTYQDLRLDQNLFCKKAIYGDTESSSIEADVEAPASHEDHVLTPVDLPPPPQGMYQKHACFLSEYLLFLPIAPFPGVLLMTEDNTLTLCRIFLPGRLVMYRYFLNAYFCLGFLIIKH